MSDPAPEIATYSLETAAGKLSENIAPLSPAAAKVMALANSINVTPMELTKSLKLDPVLAAKVLRLVNSTYFDLSVKIISLERAVIILGLNTIKNLALSAAVVAQMESAKRNQIIDGARFWKHSLTVGAAARLIARLRKVDKNIIEDYFIAGLLHDLGLLAESQIYPLEMQLILADSDQVGLVQAEETHLCGLNHGSMARILAERWSLSPDLTEAMATHHQPDPDGEHAELCQTVCLANVICNNSGYGLTKNPPHQEVDPSTAAALGIDEEAIGDILESLESEIEKATEFLRT
ncbi:MAG: HDOD domain-containing protein [Deltaproteobacteria bacterium]|nr:HDOD domain-containing protein [Deltaproteobacteria bacterium]